MIRKGHFLCFIFMGIMLTACKTNTTVNPSVIEASESTAINVDCESESSESVFVFVCGEVVNPGVYELDSNCLIEDAVLLAGGMNDNADYNYVNLAEHIVDGQRIYIPAIGELTNECISEEENGGQLININKANADELMTLPGIGRTKADCIIEYRNKNGSFKTKEELKNIQGIKDGVYNKISELITVN